MVTKMIKAITTDIQFLSQKSEPATALDTQIIEDLFDTLKANEDNCVGMAANMIGYHKSIIVVSMGVSLMAMINPVIVSKSGPYQTEEGCLSLDGARKVVRYETIEVEFEDRQGRTKRRTYAGETAQIIQHEIDHCNGVII